MCVYIWIYHDYIANTLDDTPAKNTEYPSCMCCQQCSDFATRMSTHINREMLKAVFSAERTADFDEDEEEEDEETGRDIAGPSGEVKLVLERNA